MEITGTTPTAENILRTLVELLEDQEKVKITYKIREGKNE